MPQSYTSLWYHLVWSTKHREPFIEKSWKWELFQHIKEYCEEKGYYLDFINGIEDHIHLLVNLKPTHNISTVVRDIKRDSYYWVNDKKFTQIHFSWQDGYAAFSVSPTALPIVRNYIKNQEIHHQTINYEKEFDLMVKKTKESK